MRSTRLLFSTLVFAGIGVLGYLVVDKVEQSEEVVGDHGRGASSVPVEVVQVVRGPIADRRRFTGTVDASSDFVVAAKVGGRVEAVYVDLSDKVRRDQIVVKLDDEESVQALTQAEANLAVAVAEVSEAVSLLAIADREFGRIEKLNARGVSTESERDAARANQLARSATLEVARAQLQRARSLVESARIQLGYSSVKAAWQGGANERVVAERLVDPGSTVSSNQPLIRVIELDQVLAIFFITERDYGLLELGQPVSLQTDAYPGEQFIGSVARIAPVFREATRQARVELVIDNPAQRLKPGMFVRASVTLKEVADAILIPESALVIRSGQIGVFRTDDSGSDAATATVAWQPVTTGIRSGQLVEVLEGLEEGRVVTLGQQLLKDGSAVIMTDTGGQ